MKKRIISLVLMACILMCLIPISASASNAYTINGVTIRYDDYMSSSNHCWAYANLFYEDLWGTTFTNAFDDPTNILRNLSDEELTMTPEHLEAYVRFAVPGAILRICDAPNLHGTDSLGHSLLIVQIDDNGLTVFEGGLTKEPHAREKYYTWDSLVGGYNYEYIKYIKWPTSTPYNGVDILRNPESVNTVAGTTVSFSMDAAGENLRYQWQWRAGGYGWQNLTSADSQTDTITFAAETTYHGYRYRCVVTDENGYRGFSDDAVLSVTGIDEHPQSQQVLEGTAAKFQVHAVGDQLRYQWQWRVDSANAWEDIADLESQSAVLNVPAEIRYNGYAFRCRITDLYGNTLDSEAATLTVAEKQYAAVVKQPENFTATIGTNATFTVGAAGDRLIYQWQWMNASGEWVNTSTTGYNTDTITVEATAARNGYCYRCKIIDAYGTEVYSDAAVLTVISDIVITAQPESVLAMVGETASFTVTAEGTGLTYQWQWLNAFGEWTNTTAEGYNTNTITIVADASRRGYQYRCIIADELGNVACSDAATLTVTTPNAATILRHPESVVAPIGSSVTFSLEATGDGLTYQWQFRKNTNEEWAVTTIDGSKTDSIEIAVTTSRDGYQYRCVITDIAGNVVHSEPATLTIDRQSIAAVVRNPESVTVAVGSQVQFTVEATGTGITYLWQYRKTADAAWESAFVSGSATDTITVDAILTRNGYQYRCRVTDIGGNVAYSEPATLTIAQQTETAIVVHPLSVSVGVGENAVFSVGATGDALSYQWQWLNASGEWVNTTTSGYNTDTITVEATIGRNGYQYRCKVTDGYGNTVYSEPATLTVGAALIITDQPKSATVLIGQTATFSVTAEGAGNLTYQWQWLNNSGEWVNTTATGYNTDTITMIADASRKGYQYRCLITDELNNSLYSEPATLFVTTENVATIVKQPDSVTVDVGSFAIFTLEATGDELTYQWEYRKSEASGWMPTTVTGYNTNSIQVEATMERSGYQYRCVIRDIVGNVVESEPATLNIASDSVATIVRHPESVSVPVDSKVSFCVEAIGKDLTYQWEYRKNSTATWAVTTATGNKTNTIQLDATLVRNGYQYRCKVTDAGGNVVYSNPATLLITQQSELTIVTQPTSVSTSIGTIAKFTVEATGEKLTYQWEYRTKSTGKWAATTVTGNKTDTLCVEASLGRNGYQYRCKITDGYKNVIYSDVVTLTIDQQTIAAITKHPESVSAAVGAQVQFTVEASGNGLTYQWQYKTASGAWATTTVSGNKTASIQVQATTGRNGYQYRCMVKDTYGNVVYSDPATLTIDQQSVAAIIRHPESVDAAVDSTVQFSVEATGKNLSYQWEYRKNSTSSWAPTTVSGYKTNTLTMQATLARNGYQYRCKVTDAGGNVVYSNAATLNLIQQSATAITKQPVSAGVPVGTITNFSLEATGEKLSYQWEYRKNSSANWATTTVTGNKTPTLTVEATLARNGYQYRCKIKDGYGNVLYSDVVTLTIASKLEITEQPESVTVEVNTMASFTVTAAGTDVRYQWQWMNTSGEWVNTTATGYNTNTMSVQATPARKDYQYRCKISDNSGNVIYTDPVTLMILDDLTITRQPESAMGALGENVIFALDAEGAEIRYQWQWLNGSGEWVNTTTSGYNTNALTVQATTARNGYQYRCRITDIFGQVIYSDEVTLTVFSNQEITSQPEDVTVELGGTAVFTLEASGTDLHYQWQWLNDAGIWVNTTAAGADTNTMMVEATVDRNGNQYRCKISSNYGELLYTDIVTLTVTSQLEITSQPASVNANAGDTVTFHVEATGANMHYRWQYLNDSGFWVNTTAAGYNTDTITLEAISSRNGNQYRCRITDDYGNLVYSDGATLTVTSTLEILSQPTDSLVPLGSQAVFSVEVSGVDVHYRWQYLADDGMWVNTTVPGYNTNTITVEATKVRFFNQYRCKITDDYGNLIYSNEVMLMPYTNLQIHEEPQDAFVELGGTATFTVNATGVNLTYQWMWQTASGEWVKTYGTGYNTNTLTVPATAERNGYRYYCDINDSGVEGYVTDEVTLTITSTLEITDQPESVAAPLGSDATFHVAVSGANVHYRWQYLNDNNVWVNTTAAGYNTDTITVEANNARNGNQYRCKITDDFGNLIYSDVVALTVTSTLEINAQPESVTTELGSTISFSVGVTGADVRYRWQYLNDAGNWVNTTASGYNTATITVEATGARNGNQYRCKISDDYGNLIYSDVATLTVTSPLVILSQTEDVTATAGEMVSFHVTAYGNDMRYQWQWLNNAGEWVNTTASGYRTDTLSLEATKGRNGYQYRCRITDDYGNLIYSEVITLTVE